MVRCFRDSVLQLIMATSTDLPADVRCGLVRALAREPKGSRAALALQTIALNVDLACARCAPLCQDTGLPTFEIRTPPGVDQFALSADIAGAIAEATRMGMLRPNSVDSLTGRNSGDNLGEGTPVVHFEEWLADEIELRLILKGGGCENKSAQYSLPCELTGLGGAERDLEGVRKCVLHAIHAAQGEGCSVGVVGVAIGGDRATAYASAKRELFRHLFDMNPDVQLARLEDEIVRQANALGIGTMGFGGEATLMGCKIRALNRLPASFFVTVSYQCWALRRRGVVLDPETGRIARWLYQESHAAGLMAEAAETESLPETGREVRLTTPLSEDQVRALTVGDVVLLSGVIHTARDAVHKHLMTHDSPVDLRDAALYHCGPLVLRGGDRWTILAAGPTTSSREEPYEADVIRRFGVRAVIGKGGMGARTLAALQEHGAVYLSAIGGAAQFYATRVESVLGVDLLELGTPEAMWHLRVDQFPLIVTMDARGGSLHADVERASARRLAALAAPA